MTPRQIALVRENFAAVKPIADTAAALFYDRLFALDPSLRALFKSGMREQGAKLMQMIGVAVPGCTRPRHSCRRCRASADATAATASRTAITPPWAKR